MPYLQNPEAMMAAIARLKFAPILWVDTEVADYKVNPRLSLIQVSANSADLTGDQVFLFDVLEQPAITEHFISQIMADGAIAKVFHNANYDKKFLGKTKAKNLICTLELAKKIPYYLAPKPNNTLKTLVEELCHFPKINKEPQGSDWGHRPLSADQLKYAQLDPVYTAQVHHRLLQLYQQCQIDPHTENITQLTRRYRQIEHDWQILHSEIEHLKTRIKAAMIAQQVSDCLGFKLTQSAQTERYVNLSHLAEVMASRHLQSNSAIKLTKTLQTELAAILPHLDLEEKHVPRATLTRINDDAAEIPF